MPSLTRIQGFNAKIMLCVCILGEWFQDFLWNAWHSCKPNKTMLKDKSLFSGRTCVRDIHCSQEVDGCVLCTKEPRGGHAAVRVAESINSKLDELKTPRQAVLVVATELHVNFELDWI